MKFPKCHSTKCHSHFTRGFNTTKIWLYINVSQYQGCHIMDPIF